MKVIECVERLRPGLSWKNHMVNGYSLETIAKTYLNPDAPLPTLEECEAVWPEIEAEHAAIKQARIDLKAEKESIAITDKTASQVKSDIKTKFKDIKNAKSADDKIDALSDAVEELESKIAILLLR